MKMVNNKQIDTINERKNQIWTEILQAEKNRVQNEKLPHEKSVREVMEETGMSESYTRRILERLVRDGTLTKRIIRYGRVVYSPVDKSA